MRKAFWSFLCIEMCVLVVLSQSTRRTYSEMPVEKPTTRVLFRKKLSGKRELLITEDPMIPVSAMKDLLSPNLVHRPANPIAGFISLNAELKFPSNLSLRLWSQKEPIYFESDYDQYGVLDLLLLPDQIVFARTRPGSLIDIVGIELDGPTRYTALRGWSLLGAAIPAPPGRLAAKLAYDEKNKRVGIEVTDTLQGTRQHTLFEQKSEGWDFVRMKQWEEKVPEAVPATQPKHGFQ